MQQLADIEVNTEIRSVDFEELNDRLLKGKMDLRQREQRRMSESKEFYLMKLLDFVSNVRNCLKNCYYKDDRHIKEVINYLGIQRGLVDCEIEQLKAVKLRIEKDKADEFEAENIELINGGLIENVS